MSHKQQAALRRLFTLPPDKNLLRLSNKNFISEIYRNIQTFAFQVHQECSSWVSRNGAVQIFSLHQPKTICWKISKVSKCFGCIAKVN